MKSHVSETLSNPRILQSNSDEKSRMIEILKSITSRNINLNTSHSLIESWYIIKLITGGIQWHISNTVVFTTTDAIIQIPQDVKEDIDHVLPQRKRRR